MADGEVNFRFWVGLLWGDNPLQGADRARRHVAALQTGTWEALQASKAQAFLISRDVFSVSLGAGTGQRRRLGCDSQPAGRREYGSHLRWNPF